MVKIIKILFLCSVIGLGLFLADQYNRSNTENTIPPSTASKVIKLAAQEQQWLNQHQPIRIGFDGNFPPYSFTNESGEIEGISYDTIKLISQKLNIQFEIDKRTQWTEIYQAALDKEIDVIATMVKRPDREFQFAFTQPYVFKSLVIVTHENNQQIKKRNDLAGQTVALIKNYQHTQSILEAFPTITPYYVENMHDALALVETQQVDAAISYVAAMHFNRNKYLLSHIKVAAFYDHNSANESIAVPKELTILADIFQKGLDSISDIEQQKINQKWNPPMIKLIDYETMSQIVGVFLAILVFLILWVAQIKNQSRKIKKTKNELLVTNHELNELKNNLEAQVAKRTTQLQTSEQKYRSLVENLRDEYFFYKHDLDGIFTYLSPSFTNILGFRTQDSLKHYNSLLTDHIDNSTNNDYQTQSIKGESIPAFEREVIDKSGHKHRLKILETPIYDSQGQCIGVEGLAHDITLLKQAEERLNWLSYYDDLTGLANRRLFKEKLKHILTLAQRHKQSAALLFLDLDHFKNVNDTLGHAAGDRVLVETAKRLKQQVRDSDISARMGGDEFTMILPDTNAKAAKHVAEKVLASLLTPYILNNKEYTLGTSIGVAIYPQNSSDSEELLQLADAAMYVAKKQKTAIHFCATINRPL